MASLNISAISSGEYNDMALSVKSVTSNKVLLDNISNVYNYKDIIQFPMSFLRKYENIIKANLVDYKIDPSRYYRPEYVSYDLYGTTDLWYLILFCNDLTNPMELNFRDIKVPNSLYILEILNKLKSIDQVKSTHRDPVYLAQSLIKDINSPSERILKTNNTNEEADYIPDVSVEYEESLDKLSNTLFYPIRAKLTRDIYYKNNDLMVYKESPVNFGFIPDYNLYKILSSSEPSTKMLTKKMLKSNTKYCIFKRYAGEMNLTIKSNDKGLKYVYNKKVLENAEVELAPTILTYDLREGTLAPEYLKENLILNYEGNIYDPEIITNKNNEECYGIVIDENKYEIFYDGTCYYIILDENDEEQTIAVLENKDYDKKGNQLNTYHSMNEWVFNEENYPGVKIPDGSNLYFDQEYFYMNGEYVYTLQYDNDSLNNLNNITYRIDINRDLKTNSNKLSKYQFLGFEFEVGFSYTNSNIKQLTNILNFSPMKITIVCNDDTTYTFSYPYGTVPEYVDHEGSNILNTDYDKSYNELYVDMVNNVYGSDTNQHYQINLYKYKRIIPIIKDFKDKELLDIKEILVSPYIERTDSSKYHFDGKILVSCGKLKISGLRYEDVIQEYITPDNNNSMASYDFYYDYSIKNTKYNNPNETTYFEPYIFEYDSDVLTSLTDEYNLNYTVKNNFTYTDTYTNKNYFNAVYNSDRYTYEFFKPFDRTQIVPLMELFGDSDYIKFLLYNKTEEGNMTEFSLPDHYIVDMKLNIELGDSSLIKNSATFVPDMYNPRLNKFDDSRTFLNGYTENTNISDAITNLNKVAFHNNIQILFDNIGNQSYFINLGELKYLTNNSSSRSDQYPYKNTNIYLDNFNSYPFTVETKVNGDANKTYYDKFRKIEIKNDQTLKNIINLKLDNTSYSMPGGIYKTFENEGSNIYKPYKFIEYFGIKTYPITQFKTFSDSYLKHVQTKYQGNTIDTYEIFLRIQKLNESYYISYKFNEEDTFKDLYKFNDIYKPFNNGTLGFILINNVPIKSIDILSYKIGTKNVK